VETGYCRFVAFPGITLNLKCANCGARFSVDVAWTDRPSLPEQEEDGFQETISYRCPQCGQPGQKRVSLSVT
jgi:DNA-directed RNA polymerase subunit RPC12/RpoP